MLEVYRILGQYITCNLTIEKNKDIDFEDLKITPPNYLFQNIYDTAHEALKGIKSDHRVSIIKSDLAYRMAVCKSGPYRIIIGPFFKEAMSSDLLNNTIEEHTFSQHQVKVLIDFYQKLPILDDLKIIDFFRLAIQFLTYKMPALRQVQDVRDKPVSKHSIEREDISTEAIAKNYVFEKKLIDMIEQGDTEKLQEYIDFIKLNFQNGTIVKYTNSPLDNMMISSLTLNTISSRAALRGGLSPYRVHQLSSSFAIKTIHSHSMQQLFQLIFEILETYTYAVKEYSHHGYSTHVSHAMHYMASHLYNQFTIGKMADELHVSSAHLSRQFKAETGKSPNQYLMDLKVHEASSLIKEGILSITHISELLQFSSPSHFTRVFKSITGLTPKNYKSTLLKK